MYKLNDLTSQNKQNTQNSTKINARSIKRNIKLTIDTAGSDSYLYECKVVNVILKSIFSTGNTRTVLRVAVCHFGFEFRVLQCSIVQECIFR